MGEGEHEEDEPPRAWRIVGTFGPHTTASSPGPRRDRGAGGSLVEDAARARALRQAGQQRWSASRVLYTVGGVVLVLGILLAIVLSGLAGVLFGTLALLVGVASGLIGARMQLAQTDAEARLRQRARTERRVAAELDMLAASGWVLLHDRLLAGTHHRLAHIAVGPAGVIVVTPVPTGPLHIAGHVVEGEDYRQLYAGSMHLDTWLHARQWEVQLLEPALMHAQPDLVWDGPTVAFAVHVPPMRWRDRLWPRRAVPPVAEVPYVWQGVGLRPLSVVGHELSGLPSPLSRTEVARVAAAVARICPPAGQAETHAFL